MNELQLTVVVAAVIAIAAVAAFNIRDFRRVRRAVQNQPRPAAAEEPVFKPSSAETADGSGLPSPLSEGIAVLRWQAPLSVDRIQSAIRGWRRVGSKPLAFGWDDGTGQYTPEPSRAEVCALQVGILMATRSGPVHAMEYSEWQAELDRIAKLLGAQLEIPSMSDVLGQARGLDQQCAAVDAQLTLCVTAPSVLSVEAIQAACLQCGLAARGESRFAEIDPSGRIGFTVFPGDRGDRLVLLLDVPRTAEPSLAFERMCNTAQRLSELLAGQLTDEAGRRLDAESLAAIGGQILDKERLLVQAGIAPGSSVALRLFL